MVSNLRLVYLWRLVTDPGWWWLLANPLFLAKDGRAIFPTGNIRTGQSSWKAISVQDNLLDRQYQCSTIFLTGNISAGQSSRQAISVQDKLYTTQTIDRTNPTSDNLELASIDVQDRDIRREWQWHLNERTKPRAKYSFRRTFSN